MRQYKWLIVLIFSLFPFLARADEATSQLTQLLGQLTNLQARFSQTVQDTNGNALQQTSGQMALQRPGKFRWQVQAPSKQLMIADGNRVWFYDVDLAQVTVQKQQATSKNSPAMLLSSPTQALTQNFSITQLSSSANEKTFKLLPKIKSDLFKSINLSFTKNQLTGMNMQDNFGQTTVIHFTQVKTNQQLNPNLFRFVAPKGVDVVQN